MEGLLQTEVVRALGWTLVHAIWQVTAIALLLMLALAVFRKSTPAIRYWTSLGALSAIAVLSGITFLVSLQTVQGGHSEPLTGDEMLLNVASESVVSGLLPALAAFFYKNLTTIFIIWASGVVLLSLRFAGNMWFLDRLKKQAIPIGGKWAAVVTQMAARCGRSEGSRGGKECVSKCRSRWAQDS